MASLNIFNRDLFTAISMTASVERVPYNPDGIGAMGVYTPEPIRTSKLWVESRQGKLTLIPFSERGEAGKQRVTEKRAGFAFTVPRMMHEDTITATELQDVRAFGQETELMQVESEVARRVAGPTGLQASLEYTREYHRLAGVQGYVADTDGTILYDMAAEFGVVRAAEIGFNLAAAQPNTLRGLCNGVVRAMARAAQGAFTASTQVIALCGDAFFDAFVQHPDVIRTFVNWNEAAELRGSQGAAFSAFPFAGILWVNYRGSNDNAEIAIPTDKCKFFCNAPGLFQVAQAPGEFMEFVNTPGKPEYLIPIFDRDRNAWWKMELYAYNLFYCLRPETLMTGRMEA